MTLVMAWRSEIGLTVCADSRIQNGAPITDVGQKLFQIPIAGIPNGSDSASIRLPSAGFAFAGNTLLAQSCSAIASTCLTSLSFQTDALTVSPETIAHFFERSAEHVARERRFLAPGSPATFHSMVFGWDATSNAPFIYEIEVSDGGEVPQATSKRTELKVGSLAYFGSGAQFISETLSTLEREGSGTIKPHVLMEAAIGAANIREVGGALQFATARPDGVQLRPLARIDETGAANISILGCDISKLMSREADAIFPGAGAIALAHEK